MIKACILLLLCCFQTNIQSEVASHYLQNQVFRACCKIKGDRASGSGVIVDCVRCWPSEPPKYRIFVATAEHVVQNNSGLEILVASTNGSYKRSLMGETVACDRVGDVAVVCATVDEPLPFVSVATESELQNRTSFYGITVGCSCLLYTSPSPRDRQKSRMPSSA